MVTGHFQEFEDEYLETLFDFHEKSPGMRVRNGALAKYLDLAPASVTEMIQRLARNGFVDYIPYKGVLLTETGIKHGMMIKRRHRLAEVLLAILPFEGDIHATACMMEHAIDDDLEVCLTQLLGDPQIDPSGKKIPEPSDRVSARLAIAPRIKPLADLEKGEKGEVILIALLPEERATIYQIGIEIGDVITKNIESISVGDSEMVLNEWLSRHVIVRCFDE
jgi:DtxR family Mn-dependent transcriptional regulator